MTPFPAPEISALTLGNGRMGHHPDRNGASPQQNGVLGEGRLWGRFETLPGWRHSFHLVLCAKSPPLISTFPSSVNWLRRSFRSAMLSNPVRWR
jgi:hypothetical protein